MNVKNVFHDYVNEKSIFCDYINEKNIQNIFVLSDAK